MIGIMADSHGQADTIVTALAVLTDMDCQPIYHIGDVCDSTRPETAEACLRMSFISIIFKPLRYSRLEAAPTRHKPNSCNKCRWGAIDLNKIQGHVFHSHITLKCHYLSKIMKFSRYDATTQRNL